MKNKKVKLCAVLLLSIGLSTVKAQDAIPAIGGNASGNGGSVSYTVGQVADNTNSGTTGSEFQGVQQPYETTVVTGLEEANGIRLVLSVYPNPASDHIKLKAENYKSENLSYQFLDITGKVLESKKLDKSETIIDMYNFASATYFLKVIRDKKEVKTFKIIKH